MSIITAATTTTTKSGRGHMVGSEGLDLAPYFSFWG